MCLSRKYQGFSPEQVKLLLFAECEKIQRLRLKSQYGHVMWILGEGHSARALFSNEKNKIEIEELRRQAKTIHTSTILDVPKDDWLVDLAETDVGFVSVLTSKHMVYVLNDRKQDLYLTNIKKTCPGIL